MNYEGYFDARGVKPTDYENYALPAYLLTALPKDKNASILDLGCGYCQTLRALRTEGFTNIRGADVSSDAVSHGQSLGLNVDLISGVTQLQGRHDFVIMSHVIEHLEKDEIIGILRHIRINLLALGGQLFIATPNAQSNVEAYWAYEDFTHTTLFTAGSLLYVLRTAGFKEVEFLDPHDVDGLPFLKKTTKLGLLWIYRRNKAFWNRVTGSSYHSPSPQIFTWELRALARRTEDEVFR